MVRFSDAIKASGGGYTQIRGLGVFTEASEWAGNQTWNMTMHVTGMAQTGNLQLKLSWE